jgi:hypothetical protein
MNLRRGLFRLWIVGAALFVLAVAFLNYSDIEEEFEDAASVILLPVPHPEVIKRFQEGSLKPVTDPTLIKRLERTPNPWVSVARVAAIALGIPLAVLALGSSLLWALSGFAAERRS